jgi:hypothetical protein
LDCCAAALSNALFLWYDACNAAKELILRFEVNERRRHAATAAFLSVNLEGSP